MTQDKADDKAVTLAQVQLGRRFHRFGVLGLVLGMVGAAIAFAALSKALYTSDETAHMDYAYQVWLGRLPVFQHGLLFRPPGANVPPVQWEAQHPPLFYLLTAPVVGPLINGGHWLTAVLAGRACCVVVAAACVVALSWAGSLVSQGNRLAWAIAVPAVVSPVALFMRIGGSFYIDNLAVFFTAIALGVGILAIRYGVSRARLAAAAVLAAAGMLTEASFAVTLLVLAGALVLAVWIHDPHHWPVRIARSLATAAVPVLAAGAASGWFYLRNKHLTGTFTGQQKEWSSAHLHRVVRPFSEVATSWEFWHGNFQLFRQGPGFQERLGPLVLAVTVGCAVLGWLVHFARRRFLDVERGQAAVVLVLFMQGLGTAITEIGYVSSGGAINTRYALPALLPLGCLLAAGILALPRRLSAPALAVFLVITWGFYLHWAWAQPVIAGSRWTGETVNQVPWVVVLVALGVLVLGVLAQVIALGALRERADPALTRPRRRARHAAVASPEPAER